MKGLLMPVSRRRCSWRPCAQWWERTRSSGSPPRTIPPGPPRISSSAAPCTSALSATPSRASAWASARLPWVIIITTPVGLLLQAGQLQAVTTRRVRANPGGHRLDQGGLQLRDQRPGEKGSRAGGFMEAMFLDAREHAYFEEGSSCNIFFVMKDGSLVTPSLEDTILPGHHAQEHHHACRREGDPHRGTARIRERGFLRGEGMLRGRHRGGNHPHRVGHPRGQRGRVRRPKDR